LTLVDDRGWLKHPPFDDAAQRPGAASSWSRFVDPPGRLGPLGVLDPISGFNPFTPVKLGGIVLSLSLSERGVAAHLAYIIRWFLACTR
jgi:hypothetical protein